MQEQAGRERRSAREQWEDLTLGQRVGLAAAAAVQLALAGAAWWDLAHRPAERVRGPKIAWAAAIAVNVVGPVAYFTLGRRSPSSP